MSLQCAPSGEPPPRLTLSSLLNSITRPEMREWLRVITYDRPDVWVMLSMLGPERVLEWSHSLGICTDESLRAAAPPVPPIELRQITAAPQSEMFLWSGIVDIFRFLQFYEQHVVGRPARPRILDMGCGCGRLTRFLNGSPLYETTGCDLNPNHIAWCKEHLTEVDSVVNSPLPPLPFPAASFDLAYLLSVFTHLPQALTLAWLADLARVIRPGGILILTTHGIPCLERIIRSKPHQELMGMSDGGAAAAQILGDLPKQGYIYLPYSTTVQQSANVGIDYGNAFVDPIYARDLWARHFDVLEHQPGGREGWHDIFVVRSRAS